MKKVLAYFIFAVLLCNSAVFAQQSRRAITNVEVQSELVTFSRAEAYSDGSGVWLEWETSSETKNLGFYIYRQGANGTQVL